ncbi:hypothetical protein ACGFJT_13440 [Actinomadura geliboluensis]|uniref:hypothetical protein n=1 Tax=Actinomadura geliboluensis TaxID=882440 RepID=UPI00371D5467
MPRGVQDRTRPRERLPPRRPRPRRRLERHRLPADRAVLHALVVLDVLTGRVVLGGLRRGQRAPGGLPVQQPGRVEHHRHRPLPVRQLRLQQHPVHGRRLRAVDVQAREPVPAGAAGLDLQQAAAVLQPPAAHRRAPE